MRTSQLDDLGDRNAAPGSEPYLRWFERLAREYREQLEFDADGLRDVLLKLEQCEAWRKRGVMSFETYLSQFKLDGQQWSAIREAKKGQTLGAALKAAERVRNAEALAEHGNQPGKLNSRNRVDSVKSVQGGNSADYLAARLKRDRPDIAAAVERGEYRSIRAAAVAAGIVKVPTDAERAEKALRKLGPEDFLRVVHRCVSELLR